MINQLPSTCDVVVIGAGHNGLIAANYLSRAGLDVVLVEARSDVGGCSASESFGGGVVNICNCDHITFRTTPVHDELDLAAHGLRYLDAEPSQLNLSWDGGPAWSVWKSVDDTVDELRRTYPHEADNYRRYAQAALPIARLVLDAAAAGPWRGSLVRTVVSRGGRGVRRLLQWSSMSAADVMRSFFRDERVFAPALATGPVVWGLSPELPGTGLGALTFAFRHVAQVGRPVGGSGALAAALSSALSSGGGRLFTSTRVESIVVENDRAIGVRTSDGHVVRSRAVVSAADPRRTLLEWLQHVPRAAGPTVERWRSQPHQPGYESKIDAIVAHLPAYTSVSSADRTSLIPSAMIVPSVGEMHRAWIDIESGRVAERPVMFANVPTVLDPSMAPPDRHVFSLEVLFTPYHHPGGWPQSPEPRRWLERYASLLEPGFLDGLGEWRAMTPDRYESDFHMPEGHATSFAGGPIAALRGKPRELTRYRVDVPGLYLCGAATFPGAGIWGASGRHCATTVLQDL
ncbi:MAG: putative beta-carotene ketolase [Actinomycetota bacterium]|jgi:beta-carotene ketolase (CrtO type)